MEHHLEADKKREIIITIIIQQITMTQELVTLTLPHPFGCSSPRICLLAERGHHQHAMFYLEVREIGHLIVNVLKCDQTVVHGRELDTSPARHP